MTKAFITPTYTFTPGASGLGTVDLSGISGFNIKRLAAIINQTRNEIIYSTAAPSLKYVSVAGTVVTLFADTSLHSSGDVLQVIYEEIGQKASAASHPVVLSSEQEALINDLEANQVLGLGLLGNVTETAPASDTASSGLNGRLQRIAQRISSLISLFPTTLGQKTSANSLAVVLPSDQTVSTQQTTLDLTTASVSVVNNDLVPSVDVSKYKTVFVQILTTFTGALTFQGSLDGTTWVTVPAAQQSTVGVAQATTYNGSLNLYSIPVVFKYFRLRVTTFTSGGPVTCAAFASTYGGFDYATKYFTPSAVISVTPSQAAGTITTAQITVGTTAVRATVTGSAPNASRKLLAIKPSKNNSGAIYLGSSSVTTSSGLEIMGPDRIEREFDTGDFYLISDVAGQTVEILEKV
jgi:hypothetical protein